MDISLYLYRFMNRYTVLLYTICIDDLYFCAHNSYKQDTHTQSLHFIYIYRFMYRYTILLYTTCTDGLYLCFHTCILLYNLTLPAHFARISCTALRLYSSPVSEHMYCKLIMTNESPRKITFMKCVTNHSPYF